MKPKLLIAYLILVTVPLATLAWLGVRAMDAERDRIDRQFERLTEERLQGFADDVEAMFTRWVAEWESADWNPDDQDAVRRILRGDGRIEQFFVLNVDGSVVYPEFSDAATESERTFLLDTQDIWESGSIHPNFIGVSAGDDAGRVQDTTKTDHARRGRWHTWYRQEGLQLMYWWSSPDGGVYGVHLNRIRAKSEVVGMLPDTPTTILFGDLGVRMRDEAGAVVYQWGALPDDDAALPIASVAMNAPLQTWAFDGFLRTEDGGSQSFLLALGLASVAGLVLLVGVYVYRENVRELREAEERVNFVNHVSHELKTPLTNIRMYAELLQDELPADDEQASGRLGVILNESQRLSRLITNVLTFNWNQRSALQLHPSATDPDLLVRQVIGHFQQSFGEKNIEIEFRPGVLREVMIDADVIEQIVGNLLSNVEKYAGGDQTVSVSTAIVDDELEIRVQDQGPGIPKSHEEKVFEPFERIRSDLTEGVAGTGIGLSIARDLARLHGGDLELIPEEKGAHFCMFVWLMGEVT